MGLFLIALDSQRVTTGHIFPQSKERTTVVRHGVKISIDFLIFPHRGRENTACRSGRHSVRHRLTQHAAFSSAASGIVIFPSRREDFCRGFSDESPTITPLAASSAGQQTRPNHNRQQEIYAADCSGAFFVSFVCKVAQNVVTLRPLCENM